MRQLLQGQSETNVGTIAELITLMGIGAIIGLLTGLIFRFFAQTVSDRVRFSRIFVPVILSTVIIVSTVKYSITLSLGLVGALSIVRFRSAIKEPEEIVYLFFCIAIGVTLGAGMAMNAVSASIAFLLIVSLLNLKKKTDHQLFLLTASMPVSQREESLQKLTAWLETTSQHREMIRLDHHKDRVTLRVEFLPIPSVNALDFSNQLQDILPGIDLSIGRSNTP